MVGMVKAVLKCRKKRTDLGSPSPEERLESIRAWISGCNVKRFLVANLHSLLEAMEMLTAGTIQRQITDTGAVIVDSMELYVHACHSCHWMSL